MTVSLRATVIPGAGSLWTGLWAGLCLALMLIWPSGASAADRITKLRPEIAVSVLLDGGTGSARVLLLVQAMTEKPEVELQDAVGASGYIPKANITWQPGVDPWGKPQQTVWQAEIKVDTRVNVEPGEEYKGTVLFLWQDGMYSLIDFNVKARSTDFALDPTSLDVALGPGQPSSVTFRLKNSGKSLIRELNLSSQGLVDPTTRGRVKSFTIPQEKITAELPIGPGQEREFSVDLPLPPFAGAYAGQLEVLANGAQRKSISVTIRTRGPNRIPWLSGYIICVSYIPTLPFLLFLLTLAFGYLFATLLDDWFAGGGLQRAEAIVSLRRSEKSFGDMSERIRIWEADHGYKNAIPGTYTDIQIFRAELESLLADPSEAPLEKLREAAQRMAQKTPFMDALWVMVQGATSKFSDPAKLLSVVKDLDKEEKTGDLNAYREKLREIVKKAAQPTDAAVRAFDFDLLKQLPRERWAEKWGRELKAKIKLMACLQRTLVWLVVFLAAYLTFYWGKVSFGTSQDYIALFFWTLGLTPTGTQILARARSSYTR